MEDYGTVGHLGGRYTDRSLKTAVGTCTHQLHYDATESQPLDGRCISASAYFDKLITAATMVAISHDCMTPFGVFSVERSELYVREICCR